MARRPMETVGVICCEGMLSDAKCATWPHRPTQTGNTSVARRPAPTSERQRPTCLYPWGSPDHGAPPTMELPPTPSPHPDVSATSTRPLPSRRTQGAPVFPVAVRPAARRAVAEGAAAPLGVQAPAGIAALPDLEACLGSGHGAVDRDFRVAIPFLHPMAPDTPTRRARFSAPLSSTACASGDIGLLPNLMLL